MNGKVRDYYQVVTDTEAVLDVLRSALRRRIRDIAPDNFARHGERSALTKLETATLAFQHAIDAHARNVD